MDREARSRRAGARDARDDRVLRARRRGRAVGRRARRGHAPARDVRAARSRVRAEGGRASCRARRRSRRATSRPIRRSSRAIADWVRERFPGRRPDPGRRGVVPLHDRPQTSRSCSSAAAGSSSARRARATASSSRRRSASAARRLAVAKESVPGTSKATRREPGTDTMPFYQRLGDVPRKRHIQFRENGTLLTEEVMGLEGFTGNESILYHLQSPCRVMKLGGFERIERKEWVPDQHTHLHFKTFDIKPEGDEINGRRLLMWNNDVEISLCRPTGTMDYFFRNGEGDEVVFVHEGSGVLETIFGNVPYKDGDYIVIPRGTTYRFQPEGPAALSRVRDAGADRGPEALPQPLRADHRRRAVLPPRHPSADRAAHGAREGRVPGQGARARRVPDVRRRLPPVRRRRLGRLPLSVDVLDPRLRADHRPHPPAAAVAPDLRRPELRHLLVLPPQARLRPARRCRSRTTTRTCSRRR